MLWYILNRPIRTRRKFFSATPALLQGLTTRIEARVILAKWTSDPDNGLTRDQFIVVEAGDLDSAIAFANRL